MNDFLFVAAVTVVFSLVGCAVAALILLAFGYVRDRLLDISEDAQAAVAELDHAAPRAQAQEPPDPIAAPSAFICPQRGKPCIAGCPYPSECPEPPVAPAPDVDALIERGNQYVEWGGEAVDLVTTLVTALAQMRDENGELHDANARFAKRHATDVDRLFDMEQRAERAEADVARLTREWRRECADADNILFASGLAEPHWRTDGGSLQVPRIVAHFKAMHDRAERLHTEFVRECDDADKICRALNLPGSWRTDGGSLHLPRILGAIAALRDENARLTRERDENESLRVRLANMGTSGIAVEKINGVLDQGSDIQWERDSAEVERDAYKDRAERAEADVARLTRERDEAAAEATYQLAECRMEHRRAARRGRE